jgi:hypothetical protein
LVYHSLHDTNIELMHKYPKATAWQAISIAVLESSDGYPDTALVEVRPFISFRFAR